MCDHNMYRLFVSKINLQIIYFQSLMQEINGSVIPDEVCIALGSTPVTCREVYRLLLPTICHKFQCFSSHIATDDQIKRSIFK